MTMLVLMTAMLVAMAFIMRAVVCVMCRVRGFWGHDNGSGRASGKTEHQAQRN